MVVAVGWGIRKTDWERDEIQMRLAEATVMIATGREGVRAQRGAGQAEEWRGGARRGARRARRVPRGEGCSGSALPKFLFADRPEASPLLEPL